MQSLKQWIKGTFPRWVYASRLSPAAKTKLEQHTLKLSGQPLPRLSDASFNIFTSHGEDGIIRYLLSRLDAVPPFFVDIGAGDCIKSNCANLAIHFGWNGIFLDKDTSQLSVGRKFYRGQIKNGASLSMIAGEITPGNINEILLQEKVEAETGLLSIDIDGNDYWVWKAITVIRPGIVVIEAKVEFGMRNVAVPFGDHNHHSSDSMYNGASVEALRLLGEAKGYKLGGANKQGYNLFFVRNDLDIRAATTAEILDDPSIKSSFYPESFFASHTFAD